MVWAAGIALGVVCAGCAGPAPDAAEPEPEPETKVLAATEVCGGGLFSAEAGGALERVLESSRFVIREERERTDVPSAANMLEEAYRAGSRMRDLPRPKCTFSGEPKKVDADSYFPSGEVRFIPHGRNEGLPDHLPGVNDTGTVVWTGRRQYNLEFDCVSTRVGSTQEVPLRVVVEFRNIWDKGTAAEADLVKDYRILAHSAALAVAKELGCVNAGGLPGRAEELPAPRA
ncbi:hypothetical protein ACFWBF_12505 [Streptomyces sp. NPDC060028]|uniref:hypothetical protein n=1 Tax=Streptomyces sp. NPDC060028 TaxID=3347041 RepID=UPI0036BF472F